MIYLYVYIGGVALTCAILFTLAMINKANYPSIFYRYEPDYGAIVLTSILWVFVPLFYLVYLLYLLGEKIFNLRKIKK